MNIDKLQLLQGTPAERELLLNILKINKDKLFCVYCKEKVNYKTCGIMPGLGKKEATITCGGILCNIEYMDDYEKQPEPKKKKMRRKNE